MKAFAIVKDNIIQEVLHIGGGDYQSQIDASMRYLSIDGKPIEIDSDMVKGEYFDKSLAPPEPVPEPPPEPEPVELEQPKPDPNMKKMWELTGYLQSTDWYITRYAETGKPVPAEIIEQRQAARDEISRLRLIMQNEYSTN